MLPCAAALLAAACFAVTASAADDGGSTTVVNLERTRRSVEAFRYDPPPAPENKKAAAEQQRQTEQAAREQEKKARQAEAKARRTADRREKIDAERREEAAARQADLERELAEQRVAAERRAKREAKKAAPAEEKVRPPRKPRRTQAEIEIERARRDAKASREEKALAGKKARKNKASASDFSAPPADNPAAPALNGAAAKAAFVHPAAAAPLPLRRLPTKTVDYGGKLLFSDSPEYPKEYGILYRDTVKGDGRILYYHVNSTAAPARIAVVAENLGRRPARLRLARSGLSRPQPDYLRVGRATQEIYFAASRPHDIFLAPNEARIIDPAMETELLEKGDLVYGCYDFIASSELRFSIVICPPLEDTVAFSRRARVLPADAERLRGTFAPMNRRISLAKYYRPSRDGAGYIAIGDDITDKFLRGVDATDGSPALNRGNYGVRYEFSPALRKNDVVDFYLAPLGGIYSGAMAANFAGSPTEIIVTPPDAGDLWTFGASGPTDSAMPEGIAADEAGRCRLTADDDVAPLGSFSGRDGATLVFSPPGASNLPVRIILRPAEKRLAKEKEKR